MTASCNVYTGVHCLLAAVGDLQVREQVSPGDKIELGRTGASMIRPNQVVILDGGTTALQVARQLAPDLHATIVTHSPTVAVEAAQTSLRRHHHARRAAVPALDGQCGRRCN